MHQENPRTEQQVALSKTKKTKPLWYQAVEAIASLKLTVTLMAMSIFIVWVGSLAQAGGTDIWVIVRDYFRIPFDASFQWDSIFSSLFAKIELKVFFPKSFFPITPRFSYGRFLYFPKGWFIGAVMALNLTSAHLIRFKIQAKGNRLILGLATFLFGIIVTTLVVYSGDNKDGIAEPAIGWNTIWYGIVTILAIGSAGSIAGGVSLDKERKKEKTSFYVIGTVLGSVFLVLIFIGSFNPSSMRILWQLIKGQTASLVLLASCVMLFKKRAGIVLLHGGIGLLMFSELWVGVSAIEGQMNMFEGQVLNYVRDTRTYELAVVDESEKDFEDHVVVPKDQIKTGELISHDDLPFDMKIVEFYPYTFTQKLHSGEKAVATFGKGKSKKLIGSSDSKDSNNPSLKPGMYLELIDKTKNETINTVLLRVDDFSDRNIETEEIIKFNEKSYRLSLRQKRMYKPWSVRVISAKEIHYPGTSKPKSYESEIILSYPEKKIKRKVRIWMNNPLRFDGLTLYQNSLSKTMTGRGFTGFQVVTNDGWMLPYVCCMIVGTGMIAHFLLLLSQFLRRREDRLKQTVGVISIADSVNENDVPSQVSVHQKSKKRKAHSKRNIYRKEPESEPLEPVHRWKKYLPAVVAALVVLIYIASIYFKTGPRKEKMDLYAFGKIPVMREGRVQPLDTIARTALRQMSDRQTFYDKDDKKQPAIKFLLDMLINSDDVYHHKLFKLKDPYVLNILDLRANKDGRFSYFEIRKSKGYHTFAKMTREEHTDDYSSKDSDEQIKEIVQKSIEQKQILELARRLSTFHNLGIAFQEPKFLGGKSGEESLKFLREDFEHFHREKKQVLLMFPSLDRKEGWDTFYREYFRYLVIREFYSNSGHNAEMGKSLIKDLGSKGKLNPVIEKFTPILLAYKNGSVNTFRNAIENYQAYVDDVKPNAYDPSVTQTEAFFNRMEFLYHSGVLYLLGFILVAISWLVWRKRLLQAAVALTISTLTLHTIAMALRMYISGRPPVTTLYTSAVFIGWGCVFLGLVLEWIYRNGIGTAIGTLCGFVSLIIGHLLITLIPTHQKDTFELLVPVLDTQIWLASHVVCITFGYATTFLAGFLGIAYVLMGVFSPRLDKELGKSLYRMIYGILCFAIWFSFVGTVLGGLWADDSWGRFWGWDPKENGALIIVIWNVIVLHARWGKMISERGVAVMVIAGNIVTAWSWFAVNELRTGLHNYGNSEGAVTLLTIFWISQFAIIALGCMPKEYWWSYRARDKTGNLPRRDV